MSPIRPLTPDMRLTLSRINGGGELSLSELGGGEVLIGHGNQVHRLDWETFGCLLASGLIAPTTRRGNRYVMTDAGRAALGEG